MTNSKNAFVIRGVSPLKITGRFSYVKRKLPFVRLSLFCCLWRKELLQLTVKLLNAYADMDAQFIQGDTITNSKREIEATLDTLNLAFEKLLDDLFADTAMDVSSDISVLNTLLAQEGLTEDELTKMKKQKSL